MAIGVGDLAQMSARLGLCRLGTTRLGALLSADEIRSDNNGYIWSEAEDDIDTAAVWTEVTDLGA